MNSEEDAIVDEDDTPVEPDPTEIYMFQSQPTHPGFIGTRIQSNAACESEYELNKASWGITCTNYLSVLAYSADNGAEDLATNHSVPTSLAITTVDGIELATNIGSLLSSGLDAGILGTDEGMHDTEVFSGFENDGVLSDNCSDWSSGTAAATFVGLDASVSGSNWDGISAGDCTTEIKPFFCLCW